MNRDSIKQAIKRVKWSGTGSKPNRKRVRRWPIWIVLGFLALALVSFASRNPSLSPQVSGVVATTNGDNLAVSAYPTAAAGMKPASLEAEGGRSYMYSQAAPGAAQAQAQPQPWDRMIIRTGTLQLQVESVAASLDKVRLVAGSHGGYVTQSDSRQEGDHMYASLTIQVPAGAFDAAISELRKLGVKPATENITSSDVTEEFTDQQSQLRNLEQTESRILALMGRAERIEDILNLDRELRNIRSEIERIQGRLTFLEKRSEMSTITVSLAPVIAPVPSTPVVAPNAWDPGEIALRAWNASLDVLAGVTSVLITAAVFAWWLLPLLFLGWLFLRPRRNVAPTTAPSAEA